MLFSLSTMFNLKQFVSKVALTLLMLVTTSTSFAHLMPAQQGTINLVDKAAFVVLSLPVSGMKKFNANIDANHDNRLSEGELILQRANIENYVKQGLRLYEGNDAGNVDFIQISTEQDEADELANAKANIQPIARGSIHFLVLMKISFKTVPIAPRLETDLFGELENENQFAITAIRGKDVEAIILRQAHPQHHFFQSAWQVMLDYVVTGIDHILSGFDHLLFLLTIIVAAAGWRYWVSVLTCFTIAHSITLTLSLVGWVHAPASIVEPLIAASIVAMAFLNLWQKNASPTSRLMIVFVCGLLHGMGFASSIADIGLHGTYFLMSMVGFNLGIEIGQAIFLIGILTIFAIARLIQGVFKKSGDKQFHHSNTALIKPITSIFALIAGSFLLINQLLH